MALKSNSYGGIDLLETAKDLDKRIAALEAKDKPSDPPTSEVSKTEWTPEPPKK